MNCSYCGNPVPADAAQCPSCGAAVPQQQSTQQPQPEQVQQTGPVKQQQTAPPAKSVFLAQLLSCFIIGTGQMYCGQIGKGFVIMLGSIILSVITGGIASFVCWILAIVDAGCIARRINNGENVGPWKFF